MPAERDGELTGQRRLALRLHLSGAVLADFLFRDLACGDELFEASLGKLILYAAHAGREPGTGHGVVAAKRIVFAAAGTLHPLGNNSVSGRRELAHSASATNPTTAGADRAIKFRNIRIMRCMRARSA